jgi:hypothetical protein
VNLAACGGLSRSRQRDTWFRAIALQHLPTPLAVAHTKPIISRFNPGYLLPPSDQFAALYLTEDSVTALFEIGAMLGSPLAGPALSHPRMAPAILNVHVDLQEVADLSEPASQAALETTVQELTGDWIGYQSRQTTFTAINGAVGIAPTQELGCQLFKLGFEGFRTISARVSTRRNLIVFPDNMRKGSRVEFRHSDSAIPPYVIAP